MPTTFVLIKLSF